MDRRVLRVFVCLSSYLMVPMISSYTDQDTDSLANRWDDVIRSCVVTCLLVGVFHFPWHS